MPHPEDYARWTFAMSTNVNTYLNPTLLAVCFTHCRNVEVKERELLARLLLFWRSGV
jgi:hypothetical protein